MKIKRGFCKKVGLNKRTDLTKRAELVLPAVIFIVLNLVYIILLGVFVSETGSRAFVHEQTLAKQIALIIDNAKPETVVMIEVSKALEVAEKNRVGAEDIFVLNRGDNLVKVRLREKGSYSYRYFSGDEVELELNKNWLSIIIRKKILE